MEPRSLCEADSSVSSSETLSPSYSNKACAYSAHAGKRLTKAALARLRRQISHVRSTTSLSQIHSMMAFAGKCLMNWRTSAQYSVGSSSFSKGGRLKKYWTSAGINDAISDAIDGSISSCVTLLVDIDAPPHTTYSEQIPQKPICNHGLPSCIDEVAPNFYPAAIGDLSQNWTAPQPWTRLLAFFPATMPPSSTRRS